MTNKLRSVIEGITKWRDYFPIDYKDAVPVIPYEDAKQAQIDLLDAIIEEMEEQRWKTTKNSYNSAQNELIDFFTEKFNGLINTKF